jgi:hypothetical protein
VHRKRIERGVGEWGICDHLRRYGHLQSFAIAKRVPVFRCPQHYRPIGIDEPFFTMFNLLFLIECAATDLANFSHRNARFQFVNSQADVVTIGETDFNVVAASSDRVVLHIHFAMAIAYQRYYNEARTRLSLGKDAPVSRAVEAVGSIIAKPLLGGLHHQYVRI